MAPHDHEHDPHPALTSTSEDYLKVIWAMEEAADGPVTTKGLAERLGVTAATVSVTVRRLTEQGLVDHARFGAVALTEHGREHALEVIRRHRLLETFLVERLGYGWDEVHEEAELLEHAVSPRFVDRIEQLLGHPASDPHGDPIPAADGSLAPSPAGAARLGELPPGRARIERVSDADPELLRFCRDRGVMPGALVELDVPEPFADGVRVRVPATGEPAFAIGAAAAAAIRAEPAG